MRASLIRARLRRHPLAAVIALALAGAPLAGGPFTTAHADTLLVTSCADDGSPGTLRSVVASAHDGDTIDMTRLTCGTITLEQGQIETGYLASATLAGPGRDKLTISGGGETPVFYLGVYGFIFSRLTLSDLTIAHGRTIYNDKYERAACISTLNGAVILERVDITDCHTYFNSSVGFGGGGAVGTIGLTMIDSTISDSSIRIVGDDDDAANGGGALANMATLIRSTISGNTAVGKSAYPHRSGGGGGLWVSGNLVMIDSIVTDNSCYASNPGQFTSGGGVFAGQNATILRSLIANNSADGDGGGLFKGSLSNGGRATFTIQDSTIAGNTAGGAGGALYSQWPLTITNSTLADNYSARGGAVRLELYKRDSYGNYFVLGWPDFESAIIGGNTAGPGAPYATDLSIDAPVTVYGAHNLIEDVDTTRVTLPPDTLRVDPQLNPLADNGGRSQTMAPLPGSPVIDYGANALGFLVDQRGPDFVRTYGTATDIGAYELQPPPAPQATRPAEPAKPVISANHVPTVLPVTSCADDGSPGTLRRVAAQAIDGDTIDMSGLTCSTITLTQGPIDTSLLGPNPLDHVTIVGPGKDALTVSGNGASAVFIAGGDYHTGTSPLMTLSDLTVAHGAKYDAPGCVAGVTGSIELDRVNVTDCHSRTAGGGGVWPGHSNGGGAVGALYAHVIDSTISYSSITAIDRNVAAGGGLWAGNAVIANSTISGNSATAPVQTADQGYQTAGGGVYTSGSATLTNSTISGNSVEATEAGKNAIGGGVATRIHLTATGSTFANNTADGNGGGAFATFLNYIPSAPNEPQIELTPTTITNSTFSGNHGALGAALAWVSNGTLANSTFANNASLYGGAVANVSTRDSTANYTLYLDSTIIAGNTIDGTGGHAADFAITPNVNLTMIGANNLVGSADPNVTLPPDTLNSDPLLLPLADNGGPTWTMALAPGSPAINAGSNPWAFDTDQRGTGFARVFGPAADIGAYEVQPAGDVIFVSGFDD